MAQQFSNLISGNSGCGIDIKSNATKNLVEQNWIGVFANGNAAGNTGDGVYIGNGCNNNTIGGSGNFDGNVISANSGFGIDIVLGANNSIQLNTIGLQTNGGGGAAWKNTKGWKFDSGVGNSWLLNILHQ